MFATVLTCETNYIVQNKLFNDRVHFFKSVLKTDASGESLKAALTSIFSVFMEPQEDVGNFELLLCELEQGGEPADTNKETR